VGRLWEDVKARLTKKRASPEDGGKGGKGPSSPRGASKEAARAGEVGDASFRWCFRSEKGTERFLPGRRKTEQREYSPPTTTKREITGF